MTTDLAKPDPTPMQMIARFIESENADPDRIKALMDLQHEWEIRQARRGYAEALAKFQADCPRIAKTRGVSLTRGGSAPDYYYASLDDIMREVQPVLQSAGLSVSFTCDAVDKAMKTTCYIQHGIHREAHTVTLPIPDMRVNDTQKWGAAMSYGKRYALCGALNIVVEDEDADGHGIQASLETITAPEAIRLAEGIEAVGGSIERFCEGYGIDKLGDLPRAKHAHAKEQIKKRESQRGATP